MAQEVAGSKPVTHPKIPETRDLFAGFVVSASHLVRGVHDARTFVCRLLDFFEIASPWIVGCRLRQDELDEAEDDRQMVAQRVYGRRVQPAPF